jgi:integrase
MFKRTSFQNGSLKRERRKSGPDVWVYRWREKGPDGKVRKPKVIIATVDSCPSQALARREVETLGLGINIKQKSERKEVTVQDVLSHYETKELSAERANKTPYTCDVYRGFFKTWIAPRWGAYKLTDVKAPEVESWLRSIDRANGTKVKIRNLMATLFNHAIRWEFTSSNPITGPSRGSGVRQGGKRMNEPEYLAVEEIHSILGELTDRLRTLVFLIACLGLRFSELRGLKWKDFNADTGTLEIRRGFVKRYLGDLKSKASHRILPLHPVLVKALLLLRTQSPHNQPEDWIFASTRKNGTVPIWSTSLMEDHVRPAAVRAGVTKHVNWKLFRTSVATQLNTNGENLKTTQRTLGHARGSSVTMDVYTLAVPTTVRAAHDRLVDMVVGALPLKNLLVAPDLAPDVLELAASY